MHERVKVNTMSKALSWKAVSQHWGGKTSTYYKTCTIEITTPCFN